MHPWLLGSKDENDVQGYAGTPVNVNPLTIDYPLDVGAAATVFPRLGTYYVAVDSGRDEFTAVVDERRDTDRDVTRKEATAER